MSDLDDVSVLICNRLSNLIGPRVAGAVDAACDSCGKTVSLAPSSFAAAMHLPIVCDVCVLDMTAEGHDSYIDQARNFGPIT